MLRKFNLNTPSNGLFDITDSIDEAIAEAGVQSGMVVVSVPHSTASVTVVSPWDPKGLEDVDDDLNRLVPARIDFKHQHDTPQDAAGHVRAAMIGHSRAFYLEDGKLGLGSSQKVFFWEFDGPRSRSFHVKIIKG
jgi:secondary thiamine-phosphate synthase enzyme